MTERQNLFFHTEKPATLIPYTAIAIKNVYEEQNHIGIFFRDPEKNEIKFIHLAWHCDLRIDKLNERYGWIIPKLHTNTILHTAKARYISTRCKIIEKLYKDPGLNYGLEYGLRFNRQDLSLTGTSLGFTCATFVLAILELAQVTLLDLTTWEVIDDDEKWQEFILQGLTTTRARAISKGEEPKVTSEYLEKVKNEFGSFRYRPEQVAAACFYNKLPVCFNEAYKAGRRLSCCIRL